ncbi:AMP-binding protein [uncultured Campylobacter sp.]|uniref:AMP-binding protein n=1 Tax=uncultured Campylobacter sp. TaxID=218934 RepID=UPI002625B25D|nr:AMP-binding protein [uncultured Campylobacter sp.]
MLKNLINSLKPYEREILAAAALARDLAKTGCKRSEAVNLKGADKLQSSAASVNLKGAENSNRSANLKDAENSSSDTDTARALQSAQTQEQKRAPMIEIYGEDAAEFIAFFFGTLIAGFAPVLLREPKFSGEFHLGGDVKILNLAASQNLDEFSPHDLENISPPGTGKSAPKISSKNAPQNHAPCEQEAISLRLLRVEQKFYIKTSGSTGEAKNIEKSLRDMVLEAEFLVERFGLCASDRFLSGVSHQNMFGLTFSIFVPLLCGSRTQKGGLNYPEIILAADLAGAVLISSPTVLGALCEYADAANIAPLGTIFSAGAPLSPAIRDGLRALSNARIIDIYGSSETGVIACNEGAGLKKFAPVSVQVRTDIDSGAAKRENKPFDPTDLTASSCGENSMAEPKTRCAGEQNADGQDTSRSGEQASKFNADVSDKTATDTENSPTPSSATKHDDKFTQAEGLCDKFGAKQPADKFSQTGEFTISSPWCERFESRDFGYVRADEITLLGRGDRTVKINENRVSLDLLEAKLRSHEFIGECRINLHPQRDRAVALIKLSERGEQAFRAGGKKGVTDELKAFLKPEFGAILRYFKIASKLPFNEQGKLSKKDFLSALQRYEVPVFEQSAENEFRAKVRASDFYFDGHFARFPLVPAFMQLRFVLICAKALGYELDGTQKIENLKFKNFIRPGDEIFIKITEASGKLRFEISNDKVCASGRICL